MNSHYNISVACVPNIQGLTLYLKIKVTTPSTKNPIRYTHTKYVTASEENTESPPKIFIQILTKTYTLKHGENSNNLNSCHSIQDT